MPRRSRPSYRLPPSKGKKTEQLEAMLSKPKRQSKSRETEIAEDKARIDEDLSSEDFEEGSSQRSRDGELGDSDEEVDADAPRVAVWEEDDDDFVAQQDVEENKISDENKLQNDLQNLPLGALRRAQQLLKQAVAESESESESESDISFNELQTEARVLKGKAKEKVEWSTKPLTGIGRRKKHAPVEMTAKKPVTRNRTVVDVPKIVPRDPRFLPTAGIFDPKKFQQSYGFLAENRKAEAQVLRESLTKARKVLASSPSSLRREREEEVERLERAMKRAESLVNRDRTTRVEQEVLSKTKKEEVEKRKQGKGRWFLKKGDEKEILMRARYEMLEKEGGQRAVKKAIEKRQTKISQREKRTRPYLSREEVRLPAKRPRL